MTKPLQLTIYLVVISMWPPFLAAQYPDTVWTRTFGESLRDMGYAICLAPDESYLIAGNTGSLDGESSTVYLLKIRDDGDLIWDNHWVTDGYSYARYMARTRDECYILTGQAGYPGFYGNPLLLKIDQDGNEIWHQVYEEGMHGNSAIEDANGNFLIVGGHLGNLADAILIYADADGNEIWHRIYDIDLNEYAEDIKPHPDGGYIIAGCTGTGDGDGWDIFLMKIDDQGEQEWIKYYGYPGVHCDDYPATIELTSDGGYIIGATTYSSSNTYADFWLMKTDDQCDTLWTRIIGGQYDDVGHAAKETYDGCYVMTGYSYTFGPAGKNVYVVKTGPMGGLRWIAAIGGYYTDSGWDFLENKYHELIIVGETDSFGAGSRDAYVIKLPADQVGIGDSLNALPISFNLTQNYPNPFNASTMIKYELPYQSQVTIEIYDILGRKITTLQNGPQPAGYHQALWRAEDVTSGVYFYKLQAGDHAETKKVILVK